MARRIISAGNGFIKLDDELINLSEYLSIKKENMGLNEDPDENMAHAIKFTPKVPTKENTENGVDGSWFITYKQENEIDFIEDFDAIQYALKNS
jgi:hypothetical protein